MNFLFIFGYDSLYMEKICKGEMSSILSQNQWCALLRAGLTKIRGWEGEGG